MGLETDPPWPSKMGEGGEWKEPEMASWRSRGVETLAIYLYPLGIQLVKSQPAYLGATLYPQYPKWGTKIIPSL